MSEDYGAVHEVPKNGDQFIIIFCLEVLPCKIIVFGFRSIGSQHVAQHILLAGEIF